VIKKTDAEFIHVQNDAEMEVISDRRKELGIKTFLPFEATVKICHNKWLSHECWKAHEIPQPKTFLINTRLELLDAFHQLGGGAMWLREIKGAGGRGSLRTSSYPTALSWINLRDGWGKFTAAECLSPQSTTFQTIWKDGELIVAQERERLYWELSKLSASGVTGATGTGVTASHKEVEDISLKAILAIDERPHGIFGVDLTYDMNGVPNPTEINIGRFFTTHHFFSCAGLNMPYIFVKLGFGEEVEVKKKINPLPDGMAWIRGIDVEPLLTTVEHIERYEKELNDLRDE
jgi:carbamoyl-phosphate synthase large subunit